MNRVRILLVDDEDDVRAVVRAVLEIAGYEVTEAANGNLALQKFRNEPAALVLCDLFMPDKDGLETIRALRRENPSAKIIAMSGGGFRGTVDVLDVALHFGASAILQKPLDPDKLLAKVQEVLQVA